MKYRLGKTSQEQRETLSALTEIAQALPNYLLLNNKGELARTSEMRTGRQVLDQWKKYKTFFQNDKTKVDRVKTHIFTMNVAPDHLEELKRAYHSKGEKGIQPYLDQVRREAEAYQLHLARTFISKSSGDEPLESSPIQ